MHDEAQPDASGHHPRFSCEHRLSLGAQRQNLFNFTGLMAADHVPSQLVKLISLVVTGVAIASCSVDPKADSVGSLSEGIRFEHRTHERSDGKTALTVTPVSSLVRDQMVIARETQAYAEAFASRTCPKQGYNFYAHAALASRKGEHTYVFQCN